VRWQLQRAEIQEAAPAYIRASQLPIRVQYALWKASVEHSWVNSLLDGEDRETLMSRLEAAKEAVAGLQQLPRKDDESLEVGIKRLLTEQIEAQRVRERIERCTAADLARTLASRIPLYDGKNDNESVERVTAILAQLTKPELLFLDDCAKLGQWNIALTEMLRRSPQ
jgi:hypothetical protein